MKKTPFKPKGFIPCNNGKVQLTTKDGRTYLGFPVGEKTNGQRHNTDIRSGEHLRKFGAPLSDRLIKSLRQRAKKQE